MATGTRISIPSRFAGAVLTRRPFYSEEKQPGAKLCDFTRFRRFCGRVYKTEHKPVIFRRRKPQPFWDQQLINLWHNHSGCYSMTRKRAHVFLPDNLLAEIDALVGPRGRSAFLTQVVRDEVNRRRLMQVLSNPEPLLKDEDYPEFKEGAEAWVRRMRDDGTRLEIEKLGDWLDKS